MNEKVINLMVVANLGIFLKECKESDAAHHSSRLNQFDRFAYGWQSLWFEEHYMSNPYLDSTQPRIWNRLI